MTQSISKTPLLVLCVLSLLPTVLVTGNSQVWAFTDVIIFNFFSLWVYSIVKRLLEKNDQQIKTAKFTRTLISTTIYISLLSIYYGLTYNNYDDPKWLLLIIIIGQFYLFFSSAYIVTFFAKTIAISDLKRPVKLTDYLSYTVLIVFFPIGIWWLYPKIKSLI